MYCTNMYQRIKILGKLFQQFCAGLKIYLLQIINSSFILNMELWKKSVLASFFFNLVHQLIGQASLTVKR